MAAGPSANTDVNGAFSGEDGTAVRNQQLSWSGRADTVQQVGNIPE